jgi:hypothetical protein
LLLAWKASPVSLLTNRKDALGTAAPLESVTTPVRLADWLCPKRGEIKVKANNAEQPTAIRIRNS